MYKASRSQSAMEYLMTYGWAILIIAIVIAALFSLNIFSPFEFSPKASPGSCYVSKPDIYGSPIPPSLIGGGCSEIPEYTAQFNGQSSKITAQNLEYTGIPDTVSVWVYPTGTGQQMGLVSAGWSLVINSLGEADFISESGIGGVIAGKLVPGQWNMITVTISGSSNPGVDIYINGSSNAENSLSGSLDTGYEYQIGGISASPSSISSQYRYLGYMSDVQVYNTSLSYNSIQALYQEGIGGAPIDLNNLVGWWPLNGNPNDYSGNGNNGAATNVIYTSNWESGYSAP